MYRSPQPTYIICLTYTVPSSKDKNLERIEFSLKVSLFLKIVMVVKTHTHTHTHNIKGVSLVAQLVKNPPAVQEILVRLLGQEVPLEKRQATHSNILGLSWWLRW